MKRKIIKGLLTVLGIVMALLSIAFKNEPEKIIVAVTQLVEHPALDEVYRGIVDELRDEGYVAGQNMTLLYETAQGSGVTAAQIAQKFVGAKPDVMVGIATISAQSLVSANREKKIPIVFSSVTDPIGAQLVGDLKNTKDSNVTGVSNWIEIEPQLEKFRQILPSLKKLGFIYNPGEGNSVVLLDRIRAAANKMGIKILAAPATITAEVSMATESIANKVDAIYISNDNTALSAFQSIVSVANDAKIPVFVSDTDIVDQGAVAALGPNQYQVGRETGKMVVAILKGTPPSAIPVGFLEKLEFFLNEDALVKVNLIVPDELKRQADKLFTSNIIKK